jgi:hypothetical protein
LRRTEDQCNLNTGLQQAHTYGRGEVGIQTFLFWYIVWAYLMNVITYLMNVIT